MQSPQAQARRQTGDRSSSIGGGTGGNGTGHVQKLTPHTARRSTPSMAVASSPPPGPDTARQRGNHILRLIVDDMQRKRKEPFQEERVQESGNERRQQKQQQQQRFPSFDVSCLLLEYHRIILTSKSSSLSLSLSTATTTATGGSSIGRGTGPVSPLRTSMGTVLSPSQHRQHQHQHQQRRLQLNNNNNISHKNSSSRSAAGAVAGKNTATISRYMNDEKLLSRQKRVLEDALEFLLPNRKEDGEDDPAAAAAASGHPSSSSSSSVVSAVVPFTVPPMTMPTVGLPSLTGTTTDTGIVQPTTTKDTTEEKSSVVVATATIGLTEITRMCFDVVIRQRLCIVEHELQHLRRLRHQLQMDELDREKKTTTTKQHQHQHVMSTTRTERTTTMIEERRRKLHIKPKLREEMTTKIRRHSHLDDDVGPGGDKDEHGDDDNDDDGDNDGDNSALNVTNSKSIEGMEIHVVDHDHAELDVVQTERQINVTLNEVLERFEKLLPTDIGGGGGSSSSIMMSIVEATRALQLIFWLRDEFDEMKLAHSVAVKVATFIIHCGIRPGDDEQQQKTTHDQSQPNSQTQLHPLEKASLHLDDDGITVGDSGEEKQDDGEEGKYTTIGKNDVQHLHKKKDVLLMWPESMSSNNDTGKDDDSNKKYWLCASRGMIGIIHTLLGLGPDDWTAVEETFPHARRWIQHTINTCFVSPQSTSSSSLPCTATSSSDDAVGGDVISKQQTKVWYPSGNVRPFFDARLEEDQKTDWFYGATGLVMMLLQAARVYKNKDYVIHAHVIMQEGVIKQRCRDILGYDVTSTSTHDDNDTKLLNSEEENLPGLATIALCCLQLSQFCTFASTRASTLATNSDRARSSGRIISDKSQGGRTDQDLRRIWRDRALQLAHYTYDRWIAVVDDKKESTHSSSPSMNFDRPYDLYNGMGNIGVVLWHLSNQSTRTFPTGTTTSLARLPLFSNGFFDKRTILNGLFLVASDVDRTTIGQEENKPSQVNPPPSIQRTVMKPATLFQALPHKSVKHSGLFSYPIKKSPALQKKEGDIKRRQREAEQRRLEVEKKLAETRLRRLAAEEEARKRRQKEALEEQEKLAHAKKKRAEAEARRKVELERHKSKAIEHRRSIEKRAELQQKQKQQEAAKRKEQEEKRKQAMVKARKQAQERIQAKRAALNQHESKRLQEEKEKREIEEERRKTNAAAEKKRREAILQARLQREAEQAQKILQQEVEEKLRMELHERRRQEALKHKEVELKRRETERRRRHEELLELKKKEEEARRAKKANEAHQKEADAEKRHQESMRRQKAKLECQQAEEERKRKEVLTRKKLVEDKSRTEQGLKGLEEKEERRRVATESAKKKIIVASSIKKDWTASKDASKSDTSENVSMRSMSSHQPQKQIPHYAAPTKSSNFWSLQTDPTIGSSSHYKPNLVATPMKSAATEASQGKSSLNYSNETPGSDGHHASVQRITSTPTSSPPADITSALEKDSSPECIDMTETGNIHDDVPIDGDCSHHYDPTGARTAAEPNGTPNERSRKSLKSQQRAKKWQGSQKGQDYHGKKVSVVGLSSSALAFPASTQGEHKSHQQSME